MGDWCGAFFSDTKDVDITGAKGMQQWKAYFFNAIFGRDAFCLLTGAG